MSVIRIMEQVLYNLFSLKHFQKMTEDIERLIVEAETEEEEEDKSKQVEYRVSSETQKKKKSTRYFLKTSFKY